MLSKKSKLLEAQKIKSVPRFSFRKASIGLVSAIIGTTLWFASSKPQVVNADVIPDDPDQVNVAPSGEKAAQAELKKAETATANQAPTRADTTKVAAATPKAAAKTIATNQGTTAKQTATVETPSAQKTAAPVNTTPKTETSAAKQVPAVKDQVPDAPQNQTARHKTAANRSVKTPVTTSTFSNLTSAKTSKKAKTKNKLAARSFADKAASDIGTRSTITGIATDPAHSKTMYRNTVWYLKNDDGTKSELTRDQTQVTFGQQYTDYDDGRRVYTDWKDDKRTVKLDPYTNQDLLNDLKANDPKQYQYMQKLFDTCDVSANGAPTTTFTPLDSDKNYEVYLTPRAAAKVDITVIYRDLDDNNKVLDQDTQEVKAGDIFSYDPTSKINNLIGKGYTHKSSDDTLPSDISTVGIVAPNKATVYYVGLRHNVIEYTPGEKNPYTGKDDDANLVKQVSQTVQYKGTPNAIPDNVQTTKFTRHGITDMVTGKTTYTNWDKNSDTFKDVTSPAVDGYTPDVSTVKGAIVSPTSDNITKTVTYASNDHLRPAIVHYRYDSWDSNKVAFPDKNRKIITTGSEDNPQFDQSAFDEDIIPLDGYKGTVVRTSVQGGTIHAWIVYKAIPKNNFVVHFVDQDNNNQPIKDAPDVSGTNTIGEPVSKPDGVDDILNKLDQLGYEVAEDPFKNPPVAVNGDQSVTYHLKHKKVAVSPKTERKEIIHYVDKDTGKQIAPDTTQSVSFTHNGTTDLVTGETTWTGWSANQTTNAVNVPVIDGYIATQKQVPGQTITPDKDVEITVPYNKIGQIIPVDDNGNEIPGATHPNYVNDPDDPTKVKPNQKVPDVSGYTPDQTTVSPTDPIKNTPVKYHKDKTPVPDNNASLGINVHDDDTNQNLPDYAWSSGNVPAGSKNNYDWNSVKQQLIDHGYVVTEEPKIPDTISQSAQMLTIHVKHGVVHVDPDHPQTAGGKINKGDAKWPATSEYEHDRQYIVHFVDSHGKKIAPDKVQTMRFGRDLQIDAVTGKILNPDAKWTPQAKSYNGVAAAAIKGYHATGKSANGVNLVNGTLPGPDAIDSDMSDSIVYNMDDQVPNDPGDGGIDSGKGNNDLGNPNNPKPVANVTQNNAKTPNKAPAAQPAKAPAQPAKQANALPQTGSAENQALTATALGAALILASLGMVQPRKKH